jgi:hypothetical protein
LSGEANPGEKAQPIGTTPDAFFFPSRDHQLDERRTALMHVTLAQAIAWIVTLAGAWAIVQAGSAKGVLKVKSPSRCAACGRLKVRGHCPCTR